MQKREYREWVNTVHENMLSKPNQGANGNLEHITKRRFPSEPRDVNTDYHVIHEDALKMEESFTIHLGKIVRDCYRPSFNEITIKRETKYSERN